jgi:hypothetical protein
MSHSGAGSQPRWWDRHPGRLEFEVRALQDAGYRVERDEQSFLDGVARLLLWSDLPGVPNHLVVTFPDLYPYFRFEVEAPGIPVLEHHQQPFTKNLCLLGRSTLEWSTSDTVASILREQLPALIRAGSDPITQLTAAPEEIASLAASLHEEAAAEPFSEYYGYRAAMIVVDGAWRIPATVAGGTFTLGILGWTTSGDIPPRPILHGAVLSVRDDSSEELACADQRLLKLFAPNSGRATMEGRWIRRDSPHMTSDEKAIYEACRKADPRSADMRAYTIPASGHRVSVYATLFPEEVAHRHTEARGWLFAVRVQGAAPPIRGANPIASFSKRQVAPPAGSLHYLARTGRAGPDDMGQRAPELFALKERSVAVVGIGCLGAPSALEFARAGVGIVRILDADFVDPATTMRWPLGLPASGMHKVAALGSMMHEHYPYTETEPEARQLGGVHTARDINTGELIPSDYEVLAKLSASVSLIYDASAEFGVQFFMSEYACAARLPYISVTATPGAWGGRVVRIRPDVTEGCWSCLELAFRDGTLPEPPADSEGWLQPEGCAARTYIGANFELGQVAAQGVRLAISTLCEGDPSGFPSADWDVAIVSLREPNGRLKATTVKTFALARHPECPVCASRSS